MEKKWIIKPQGDSDTVERLAQEICMPRVNPGEEDIRTSIIVANLLVQRGIRTSEQARTFFNPDLNLLHDPFLMKDMDRAVERILVAVNAGENILIYGDYDVDGTSAVALVYSYLGKFYNNIKFYIPDRYKEGYGISFTGVDFAEENDISLIICLDCGIKATEEIAYAREKNIDFIVCDHHLPGAELPKAYAILDPKVKDSAYPYDELSGCGVGFKLIQALQRRRGLKGDDIIPYLDLVAVSIAADVVPLTGENRILAHYGLKVLNHKPRIGLEAILALANVKHDNETYTGDYFNRRLTISDLGFLVGPRINAAGRMDSGRSAVELLISTEKNEAIAIAEKINANNEDRKNKDKKATEEAKEMIACQECKESKSIVLYNCDWHQGIVGIVASRIAEEENKPTIIFTKTNGFITGSARSVKNFDIYTAIERCRHLLTHFGGHKFAAGLSMEEKDFLEFKRLFEKEVEQSIQAEDLIPEISIDMEIELSDINDKLFRIIRRFEPFGPENSEPLFTTNSIYAYGTGGQKNVRTVGKNHLKFEAISSNKSSKPASCIGFKLGDYCEHLREGKAIAICYSIEENIYNKHRELQLNIRDIKKD